MDLQFTSCVQGNYRVNNFVFRTGDYGLDKLANTSEKWVNLSI